VKVKVTVSVVQVHADELRTFKGLLAVSPGSPLVFSVKEACG